MHGFAPSLIMAVALAAGTSSPAWCQVISAPLATNASSAKQARFSLLDAEITGMDLVHRFPDDAPFDLMTDQYSGSGVCVGDVDGDGFPDIFFTNYDHGNRLYRNLGDWKFEDITDPSGVGGGKSWSAGASFADIDNDGDLDLFVCVYDGPNLLYVNDGSGKFKNQAKVMGVDFAGASVMMAFADYDRDGDLDGYLVTHRMQKGEHHPPRSSKDASDRGIIVVDRKARTAKVTPLFRDLFAIMDKGQGRIELVTAGQEDILYRNDSGKFTAVNAMAGITGQRIGLAATWWDYNEDGWPDLYVSNDYKGADQLYRNQKDGTFTDVIRNTVPHTPWLSMGSDLGDINNDGRIDFLATDMAGTNHFRQKMGMGDMSEDQWFLILSDPQQYMRNALYLNTGTDRIMEVGFLTELAQSDWTWSPKFGDLDNDGRIDLFVTNGMSRNFMDSDLAKGFKGWRSEQWAKTPVLKQRNLAFRNAGDLRFDDASDAWGLDQAAASYGAALADLDRDGDLDIIHTNFDDPVSVWRNDAADGNALLIRLVGTKSNRWGIGAKLTLNTGDAIQARYLTLSRGFMSANEPLVHFGLGKESTVNRLTIEWPAGTVQTINSLAANRLVTVTESNSEQSLVKKAPNPWFKNPVAMRGMAHRERPYDDYAHQPLLPAKQSQLGPCLATDGNWIYLGGAAGQPGMLTSADSKPTTAPFRAEAEHEDMDAVFFDADGDEDNDLYVVSGGVESKDGAIELTDRLYLQEEGRGFVRTMDTLPDVREAGGAVAAADIDHDGDIDLFVGGRTVPNQYPQPANSYLLINEGEKFAMRDKGLGMIGIVTDAQWADADGDGWDDLFVSCEWGAVQLFLNQKGMLLPAPKTGLENLTGWWNTIALADLDSDGDVDIAAGNYGLNTKYHASAEHPTLMFYSDFEGVGSFNIVEAEYEGDVLYPGRGKSCSTGAIPSLAKKFAKFREFASASLEEIYGPSKLNEALRLDANTLGSGIFQNTGKGRFLFKPFPRFAQAAPVFDFVVGDVTGDQIPDLYLVGNHFSPQPETGRTDGGVSLLLKGLGMGAFDVVLPAESGLVLPGDTKAAIAIDWNSDGLTDYLAAQNDGPLYFLERGKR
jgi:hypothetical protein